MSKELFKEFAIQIGSGGCAGFIEICIMHPLDLVKTRLQLQTTGRHHSKSDPKHYSGVFDCFRKMYINEGLTSYWKGILPPIAAETPKRAIKFFTFEQYKQLFMFGSPVPTPLTYSLAGFCAGVTEGAFVNPFEVVKITLQASRTSPRTFSAAGFCAGVTEGIFVNPFEYVKVKLQADKARGVEKLSTWIVTKRIMETEGLWGFKTGIVACMLRSGIFNLGYFGIYHSVKGMLPEFKDPVKEFVRRFAIGFCAGTLSCCMNIPFDVAKSRIQGPQPVPGQIKYRGTFQSMNLVYREEGFLALYKGLVPKIMRLGPGGAIMLIAYDTVNKFLTAKLKDF